ncbi:hypothetical protein N0V94_003535 [Neodidymelliopsis sp. IMI 364377]|nr:hypothetical protein N0V94_003535 [Neodidymelliopsis sp. IMI 364377]
MPPADAWDDYSEDEWYRREQWASGARHVPKPQREHFGRRTSEYLNPEVHYSSGLHRTKSQGHGVTPNVTIYNTTRMDNESSPNVRTTTDQKSREPSSDGRGRTRRMPGEWGLEDDMAELRLQVTRERLDRARSHSRGDYQHHHSHSPDRAFKDKLKLSLAEQKLREAEAKIEAERREQEAEKREELIRRKIELKYIRDRQEREDEEDRIKHAEERLRTDWDLKREKEDRAHERRLREEEEKRDRIIAESRAKAAKEQREKKDERERILSEMEKEKREADAERSRLIAENTAIMEKEARRREDEAKAREAEAKRIILEAQAKREKAEREEKEAQQRAVDAYNKKKAKEEKEAAEERDRVIYEYERKKVADAEKAKKAREELIMQMKIEEEKQKQKDKEEYEAFQRKQQAIKDAEKAKHDKEEKELEEAMRKRLAQFGFQENQIQAMVHPEQQKKLEQQVGMTPHNPLRIAPQPTFAKIRREYLDIETLHYYDIPYEYDTDPNYIIVLREMSQKETDILFEHTRRLRSNHGDRLFIEADGRDRRGKKEYAFVRRKSRSRSRSDVNRPARNVTLGDMFFR